VTPFELRQPGSLTEALALLGGDPSARPLSGGTALMLMMKAGVLRPSRLVSLGRLSLGKIEAGPDGALHIGAMATLRSLEKSAAVARGWPAITKALRTLSNVRVRNVATVGGALAHADPHMENTLKAGEIITQVEVPALGKRSAAYLKCTTRSADDWPAVGVAVSLGDEDRIFVSAAVDRPTRISSSQEIEKLKIDGDLHGSAEYKRQLLRVFVNRAINEARNAGH